MQLIDLSHTIEPGMPLFSPRAPQPIIRPWMSHSQATATGSYQDCTCEVTQVSMLTSIGTYMDSPYHFVPDGPSIEALNLEQLVLPGVVVDCTHVQERVPIGPETLDGIEIEGLEYEVAVEGDTASVTVTSGTMIFEIDGQTTTEDLTDVSESLNLVKKDGKWYIQLEM